MKNQLGNSHTFWATLLEGVRREGGRAKLHHQTCQTCSSHYKWLDSLAYQHPVHTASVWRGKLFQQFNSSALLFHISSCRRRWLFHTPPPPHTLARFLLFFLMLFSLFFQMICCTTLTTSSSSYRERERKSKCSEMRNWKMSWNFSSLSHQTLFSAAASLLVQCDLMKNFVFVFTRAPLVVVPWTTSHHQHVSSCSIAHPTPSSCERQQCVCVRSLLCLSYFRIHKSLCWCFYRESHTIFKEWMIKDFINIFIGN